MLARSLPAVSGAMAMDAFVVETAHQMAYRPRLRDLCLRLGVKDWQVAGLARSLAGTGTALAWRAEQ